MFKSVIKAMPAIMELRVHTALSDPKVNEKGFGNVGGCFGKPWMSALAGQGFAEFAGVFLVLTSALHGAHRLSSLCTGLDEKEFFIPCKPHRKPLLAWP